MLDPRIDTPGEPFSYFWHPTDVMGLAPLGPTYRLRKYCT